MYTSENKRFQGHNFQAGILHLENGWNQIHFQRMGKANQLTRPTIAFETFAFEKSGCFLPFIPYNALM